TEDWLVCFDVRHEALHPPGEHNHVRTFVDGGGSKRERVIGLCSQFDRLRNGNCAANGADILTYGFTRGDLANVGGFPAMWSAQLELNPSQSCLLHASGDLGCRIGTSDCDAADNVTLPGLGVTVDLRQHGQILIERRWRKPRTAVERGAQPVR